MRSGAMEQFWRYAVCPLNQGNLEVRTSRPVTVPFGGLNARSSGVTWQPAERKLATQDQRFLPLGIADKQPLVFLPGLFETCAIWDDICASFPDRTTISVDLPGHSIGATAQEVADSLADGSWMEATRNTIDAEIGGDTFHLIGHSSGGLLGLMLAVQMPERLESLILVGTPISGHRDIDRDLGALLLQNQHLGSFGLRLAWRVWLMSRSSFEAGLRSVMSREAAARVPDRMRETLRSCEPESFRQFALWLLDQDITPLLNRIDTPTLALIGARDNVVPPEHQLKAVLGTKTAQAQVLRDNHVPFLEDPDRFVTTLTRWFDHGLPAQRAVVAA